MKKSLTILLCLLYGSTHAQFTVYNDGMTTVTIQSGLTVSILGGYTAQNEGTANGRMDNQGTLQLTGNWTNNNAGDAGTRNPFSTNVGTVIFTGPDAQTIGGLATTTFHNLTVSKASENVTLAGGTTTVNNTLTMTTGHIISSNFPNTSPMLALINTAIINGGSDNSFIVGQIQKSMDAGSSLTYPLGSVAVSRYRPAAILATSAAGTWTLSYVGDDPTTGGYSYLQMNTANIRTVSRYEYWHINRTGAALAGVSLSYDEGSYSPPVIGIVANLRVARWNATALPTPQWDLPPGGVSYSQTGDDVTGTVTVTNVTDFSPFTLASLDIVSPLPIEWLSFTAQRAGNDVLLQWETAQEINNDHFEIERSEDGVHFYTLGEVAGAGNSTTPLAYQYLDKKVSYDQRHYYRIKQVDFDGKYDYSAIVAIRATAESIRNYWVVYPNPFAAHQALKVAPTESNTTNGNVKMVIISTVGQIVFQGSGSLEELNEGLEKASQYFGTGAYVLQVTDGMRSEMFRIVRY